MKYLQEENSDLQKKYNSLYNINELLKKKNEIYINSINEYQKKLKDFFNWLNTKIFTMQNDVIKFKEFEKNKNRIIFE